MMANTSFSDSSDSEEEIRDKLMDARRKKENEALEQRQLVKKKEKDKRLKEKKIARQLKKDYLERKQLVAQEARKRKADEKHLRQLCYQAMLYLRKEKLIDIVVALTDFRNTQLLPTYRS